MTEFHNGKHRPTDRGYHRQTDQGNTGRKTVDTQADREAQAGRPGKHRQRDQGRTDRPGEHRQTDH